MIVTAPMQANHLTIFGDILFRWRMDDGFPVLIDSVGSNNDLFSPPVAPAVEIDGIAASVFTDIDPNRSLGLLGVINRMIS